MDIKVSVIVPVYNAERYLADCLGNLVNQTLSEIEIIIINDCSTDNSIKIINDCKAQFKDKIKVINFDKNQGPGAARNAAIEIACGKYIGFVDSDDIADISMYEKMYTEAEKHDYDVVDCGFYNEKEQQAILFTSDELKENLDNKKRSELIAAGGYICTKIFKKKYLMDYHLRFRNEYVLEDSDFLTFIFSTIKSIGNVKEVLYKYTYTKDSLSSTTNVERYMKSVQASIKAIYEKTSKLSNYDQIRGAVEYQIIQMYSYAVVMILLSVQKKKAKKIKDLQKEVVMLSAMAAIKKELIVGDYENNIYVKNKINEHDIHLMKMNDQNSEALVTLIV
ncbi:glycosyltransferase family 2 protein [[Clostridium] fimetarium]|uniref:Glycosyltransferase involved in cell wall bisynthesis n=1 Tax=[Clostridium] fimetarium TaxID=99656 RepID=A0A1I0P4N6_9FIRM|nr:glycosyltransferase [[Clostridium] fimetarium]SEW09006.1 Glycosyltransferase involved in cell wall bisynthesis [[Clostridium] fimetarium]